MMTLGGLFAVNAVSLDIPLISIPAVTEHFGLAPGKGQAIAVAFLLGYALAHIPVGMLGDRFGRRPVILIGMSLAAAFALVACMAPSFNILVAARFAQGLASASGGLLARAIMRDVASGAVASRLTSNALAILTILIIVLPLASTLILDATGWRGVFGIVFVFAALVSYLTYKFIPETFSKRQIAISPWTQLRSNVRDLLGAPRSIFAAYLGGIFFATYFVFTATCASALVDIYDLPATYFAPIFALMSACQFVAALLNGRFVIRAGMLKMLRYGAGVVLCALALSAAFLLTGHFPLFGLIVVGLLFSISVGFMLPNSIALTLEPLPQVAGFAASILGMFQTGMAALVGFAVSIIYDGSAPSLFSAFCLFGTISCVSYILFMRTFREVAK